MNSFSLVTILVGVVAPLIVKYITPSKLNSGAKSAVLLAVNAAAALGDQYIANPHGSLTKAATEAVIGYGIATGTHYQIWKKLGVTNVVDSVEAATPTLNQPTVSAVPDAGAVATAVGDVAKALGSDAPKAA